VSFGDGVPKISLASPEGAAIAAYPVSDGRASHGRTPEDDYRIAVHESGHATVARLLNVALGGMTIESNGSFGGMVYGLGFFERFCDDTDDLTGFEFCERMRPLMPLPGESRDGDVADIVQHSLDRLTEIVAGSLAEELLLSGDPWPAQHDRAQAQSFSGLICTSPESAAAFIRLAEAMCRDLLEPHLHVVAELAAALRIERAMTGERVDQVIAEAMAEQDARAECQRRADWRQRMERAASFACEVRR
jgi:hypothetical protein